MSTVTASKKAGWSRGDKALIVGNVVILGLIVAIAVWYKTINTLPSVSVSAPILPAHNACDDFIAASNTLIEEAKIGEATRSRTSPYSLPGDYIDTLAEKEAVLRENTTALNKLRTGFAYPYQDPTQSLFDAFPYYMKFREMAELLVLESQVKAAHGDWNGTVNSGLDAMQLGAMIPHGSPFLGNLNGILDQATGRSLVWSEIDHLNAAQSEAAARRLEKIQALHVPYADALQKEKWEGQVSLLKLMQEPGWRGKSQGFFSAGAINSSGIKQQMQLYFVSNKTIMANYTQYLDKSIAQARLPYGPHSAIPRPNDSMSQMLLPDFDSGRSRDTLSCTENALLTVTLALRAYHLEHGGYPATLSALVPTYLSHIPDDPYDASGTLRYKTSGIGYTLYSIGPDGTDDGGKAVFDATKPAPSRGEYDQRYDVFATSKGDIVAGINKSWGVVSTS